MKTDNHPRRYFDSKLAGLSAGLLLVAACGSFSETTTLPNEEDLSWIPQDPVVDQPTDDEPDTMMPPDTMPVLLAGTVRLANLLQKGPALDFCYRVGDAVEWSGPVLSAQGQTAGAAYAQLSSRVGIEGADVTGAVAIALKLVSPGSACEPIAGTPEGELSASLKAGGALTLVAFGVLGGMDEAVPRSIVLIDDVAPKSGTAKIRAFHGSFDTPPFDVTVGPRALISGVRYGTSWPGTTPAGVSAGYTSLSMDMPLPTGTPLALKAGTLTAQFGMPSIEAGQVISLFATGRSTPGVDPELELLFSVDSTDGSTSPSFQTLMPL